MDSIIQRSKNWLSEYVFPLWLKNGVDWERGGFVESLSLEGEPQDVPRRGMVQARQIYSLRIALEMGVVPPDVAKKAIAQGVRSYLRDFSHPSGAFHHSIDRARKPLGATLDLYSQAFALFGLANAFATVDDESLRVEIKERAKKLVRYLTTERRAEGGGFTEFSDGKIAYQSNPHMHLFEAAVAWMEADPHDATWKSLADEVLELCLSKFVDSPSGALAEFFIEGWSAQTEGGRFVYEPGHQYEWSWLMGRYQALTEIDLSQIRNRLFELSERTGIHPKRRAVVDQIWSDHQPKLNTSRFWPQCERAKAAAQLGQWAAAEEAMIALFRFFELPKQGLWYDTWEESGQFRDQPAKASSLYHIIGAMSEIKRHRIAQKKS